MSTHEQIAREAYVIWRKRVASGDPEANNPDENWRRAESILNKRELEHTWKLGEYPNEK